MIQTAQKRSEDPNYDIVGSHFPGTWYANCDETITAGNEGNATMNDSMLRIRLAYDHLAPGNTEVRFASNVSCFYWKTVPVEDGGTLGRPYVFRLANANCDEVFDST